MKKVGITGQNGFVGYHLYNTLGLNPEAFELINFDKTYFEDKIELDRFVKKCDVIVHLAAMNRHDDPQVIYDTNVFLTRQLIESLERTGSKSHVLYSSSSQEENDNLYGKSKLESRRLLSSWAKNSNAVFTGMIIPNVFGPFGKPNYNSFISTFCYKLVQDDIPKIDVDGDIKLIYVGELVGEIIKLINESESPLEYKIEFTTQIKVSEVLLKLENYKRLYFEQGEIPELKSSFDFQLFNTFRSYFGIENFYPVKFKRNIDARGAFVEIIRLGIGGQCSFSTTVPGITRGNHFHTRKIERFAVIKGKALIQLRKINTEKIYEFFLDGENPAFVDMPIWYTHNIKNVGEDELITIFWINEPYDEKDPDTYFVEV